MMMGRLSPETKSSFFIRFASTRWCQTIIWCARSLPFEAPHPILPQIARESYRQNQSNVTFLHRLGQEDIFTVFARCPLSPR